MDKYDIVRQTILENHEWNAWKIAAACGLLDTMGHDEAVEYVRTVRKKMRAAGELVMPEELPKYAEPEDRLADVLKLFELRGYNVPKKVARPMLLCMSYWTMLLKGNFKAIDEAMSMNERLKRPLPFAEIEQICNAAQEYGFNAMDDEKNREAEANGFPDAGLNWTSASLYYKFMVTDDELPHLKTIGKPVDKTKPWGVPRGSGTA